MKMDDVIEITVLQLNIGKAALRSVNAFVQEIGHSITAFCFYYSTLLEGLQAKTAIFFAKSATEPMVLERGLWYHDNIRRQSRQ